MKRFETVLIVLAVVFMAALIGIAIQVLSSIVCLPIWFLFKLYGGIL